MPGNPDDPEDARRFGVSQPFVEFLEDPLAAREPGQMQVDVCVEIQRIEAGVEAQLRAFEIQFVLLQGIGQALESGRVRFLLLVARKTVAHVEPLDSANGERRLAPDHHNGNHRKPIAHCATDFVQAKPIRPAHGMRRHQKYHPAPRRIGRGPLQPVLNACLPISTRRQAVGVEPDFASARHQIFLQLFGQGRIFVVSVTEKNPFALRWGAREWFRSHKRSPERRHNCIPIDKLAVNLRTCEAESAEIPKRYRGRLSRWCVPGSCRSRARRADGGWRT